MLGSIIGDIVGAVYEFDNYRQTDFEPFFHPKAFFTDDTVCTIAVADALTSMGKGAAWTLKDWGRRYWHIGGWGVRFGNWLQSDSYRPYGSCGNGAAMRVSPAGLLGQTLKETISYARWVTEVTHDHPEGLKGAEATAVAIFLAKQGSDPAMIRKEIESRYGYNLTTPIDVIRQSYQFNETCQETVPQALNCALSANDFESAVRNAISIGGDSDTVAAIAGGLAEALFGIPKKIALQGISFLPEEMLRVLDTLYNYSESPCPWQG